MPHHNEQIERLHNDPNRDAAAMLNHFIAQWSRGTTFASLDGRQRSELLPRLAQILHAMSSPEDYRAIAGRVLDACLETVPADRAVLLLRNKEDKLAVTLSRGREISDQVLQGHSREIQQALSSREPLFMPETPLADLSTSFRHKCFFPVISDKVLSGILYLDGIINPAGEIPPAAQIWSQVLALLFSHSQLAHGKELLNGYLRNMQEKVIWSDKIAVHGRIAASAGHELNNLLTVLAGNLELAKSWLQLGERPERIRERLELLQDVLQSASQISQGLMSREPLESQLQRCSINALVVEAVELLKPLVGRRGARFELSLGASLPDVLADAGQIRQVMHNLLLNAVEARADVLIQIRVEHDVESQRIRLIISDNGPGIPGSQLAALFTPMYICQEKGSSLGLVVCKEIVERHGGSLRVESAEGAGCSCSISLPQYGAETQVLFRKKINRKK